MSSIKDVAKHANVSIMTVSRVINHPHLVREDLQDRVKQSMHTLNYAPNRAARALVSKKTNIVQFVINETLDTIDPYAIKLLSGISKRLAKSHYALLFSTKVDPQIECDGFIVAGLTKAISEEIKSTNKPAVAFGENNLSIPFVDVDNFHAMQVNTYSLILASPTKRIVYFGIKTDALFAKERESGFITATEQHQVISEIIYVDNEFNSAREKALKIIPVFEPDTIICSTDLIARGVIEACTRLKKSIPDDIAITGFDGVLIDQIIYPKLTTLKQPLHIMGEQLAQLMIDQINGQTVEMETYFEPEYLQRDTTRKL